MNGKGNFNSENIEKNFLEKSLHSHYIFVLRAGNMKNFTIKIDDISIKQYQDKIRPDGSKNTWKHLTVRASFSSPPFRGKQCHGESYARPPQVPIV
jgi:hypothetical protein